MKKVTLAAAVAMFGLVAFGTSALAGTWTSETTETILGTTEIAGEVYTQGAAHSSSQFQDVTTVTEILRQTLAINPAGKVVPGKSTSEIVTVTSDPVKVKVK
jgi:hypothetical protein